MKHVPESASPAFAFHVPKLLCGINRYLIQELPETGLQF